MTRRCHPGENWPTHTHCLIKPLPASLGQEHAGMMAKPFQPPDRSCDVPVWRQIEQQVLQQIRSGQLRGGAKLPSALELARQLRVNRHTVRRALDALEERGAIHADPGRGLRVREECYDYAIGRRTSFSRNMNSLNVTSGNRVLGTALVIPPQRVAESLE